MGVEGLSLALGKTCLRVGFVFKARKYIILSGLFNIDAISVVQVVAAAGLVYSPSQKQTLLRLGTKGIACSLSWRTFSLTHGICPDAMTDLYHLSGDSDI